MIDGARLGDFGVSGEGWSGCFVIPLDKILQARTDRSCLHSLTIEMSIGPPDEYNVCGRTTPQPVRSGPILVWIDDFLTPAVDESIKAECTNGPPDCAQSTIGGPVDVASGRMYYEQTDLAIDGPLPIRFTRHYQSKADQDGILGYGWTHSYGMRLASHDSRTKVLVTGEGRRVYFNQDGAGGWQRNPYEHLRLIGGGAPAWVVIDKHDTRYDFDAEGKLTQIRDRTDNRVVLTYDANDRLETIGQDVNADGAADRSIVLHYVNGRLERLTAGTRAVLYEYDNGNLTGVRGADGSHETYEYDTTDPHELRFVRINGTLIEGHTYAGGKVVATEKNGLSYSLSYVPPAAGQLVGGKTTVTNAQGGVTEYTIDTFNGTVTERRGVAGCGGCGVPGEHVKIQRDAFLNPTRTIEYRSGQPPIVTDMTYDDRGNMLTRAEGIVGDPDAAAPLPAALRTWTYTYDPTYNYVTSETIPTVGTCDDTSGLKRITNSYVELPDCPARGNLCKRTISGCEGDDPLTNITRYRYGTGGRIESVDGPRGDVSDITRLQYYTTDPVDPS